MGHTANTGKFLLSNVFVLKVFQAKMYVKTGEGPLTKLV